MDSFFLIIWDSHNVFHIVWTNMVWELCKMRRNNKMVGHRLSLRYHW